MIHPHTEVRYISEAMGYGVVATRLIPKGTVTWVQDELDQIFSPHQVKKMGEDCRRMLDKYSFRNNKGNYVLCWDQAKYVNHSFTSNCLSTAYDFEVAVRDIQAGEELTDDYGYLNIEEPFKARDEGVGRTVVYPDDLLKFYPEWDEKLAGAFRYFQDVNQPLLKLIPQNVLKKIQGALEKEEPLDSILNLYYQES